MGHLFMMIGVLLLAAALRFMTLSRQSLWFDELITIQYIVSMHLDPAKVEARTLLYVLFAAPTTLISPNALGVRWPSAAASLLSVALAYQLGKRFGSPSTGVVAAILMTITPMFVFYGHEARYYIIMVMLALFVLWQVSLFEQNARWVRWCYPLTTAFLVGFHLYASLWMLVLTVLLGIRKAVTGRGPAWWVLAVSAISMTAMVGGIWIVARFFTFGFGEWIDNLPRPLPVVSLLEIVTSGSSIDFGASFFRFYEPLRPVRLALALFLLCLIMLGAIQLSKRKVPPAWSSGWAILLLTGISLGPPMLVLAASYLIKPLWQIRYLIPSVASFTLLASITLMALENRWLRTAGLGVILLSAAGTDSEYYLNPVREDWRGAVTYIAEHRDPGDMQLGCMDYYRYAGAADYYANGAEFTQWSVDASSSIDQQSEQFQALLGNAPRVWVLARLDCPLNADGWPDIPALDRVASRSERISFHRMQVFSYVPRPPEQ